MHPAAGPIINDHDSIVDSSTETTQYHTVAASYSIITKLLKTLSLVPKTKTTKSDERTFDRPKASGDTDDTVAIGTFFSSIVRYKVSIFVPESVLMMCVGSLILLVFTRFRLFVRVVLMWILVCGWWPGRKLRVLVFRVCRLLGFVNCDLILLEKLKSLVFFLVSDLSRKYEILVLFIWFWKLVLVVGLLEWVMMLFFSVVFLFGCCDWTWRKVWALVNALTDYIWAYSIGFPSLLYDECLLLVQLYLSVVHLDYWV